MIGLYSGRKCEFKWETSLEELGIELANPIQSQTTMDHVLTAGGHVDLKFSATAGANATASLKFNKQRSFASQGYEMVHSTLPIGEVERRILNAIESDQVSWNPKWLVISELWEARAFTTLISARGQSESVISTAVPIQTNAFNIADINLRLNVSMSKNMSFQEIAKEDVRPYFQIHKVRFATSRDGKPLGLNKYGRKTNKANKSLHPTAGSVPS
jgi:hypothetical protein